MDEALLEADVQASRIHGRTRSNRWISFANTAAKGSLPGIPLNGNRWGFSLSDVQVMNELRDSLMVHINYSAVKSRKYSLIFLHSPLYTQRSAAGP